MTDENQTEICFRKSIVRLINDSDKTQVEIAIGLGYANPNIIAMFKSGATRVPLYMVEPLALILNADPRLMLRSWLDTYMPGSRQLLERLLVPASPQC